jgi:predicted permease
MMERLLRRIRYWLRARGEDEALREELEFHHAMTQHALEQEGMDAAAARLAARRDLGNATLAREQARAIWIWPWLDSVRQDVRYAVRSLWRQPGFTLVSLVVLGSAIGLNTSLFTVFAGLVIRPMPGVADADRVVTVAGFNPLVRAAVNGFSFPEYEFLASQTRAIAGLVAHRSTSVRLETERVGRSTGAYLVTANYFDVLGVRMAHGRRFQSGEDRRGSQAVAILSYELWQTRFGATAAIVGRQVRVNGLPVTVVGILSREFGGPEGSASRIWLPFSMQPLLRPNDPVETGMLDTAAYCCVNVTGRLAPDAARETAQAELQLLSGRFRASAGLTERALAVEGTQFLRGGRADGDVLAILGVLFAAMTLVLLIACANVGNLLLARAAARVREIGVRLSLGAGRARIVRQLLTEGFVLAFIGSALGVLLAAWLPPLVLRFLSGDAAPFDLKPDGWVLGYGLLLAVVSCVAFALAPALHATSGHVANALKDDSKVLGSRFPLRTTLLAVQVAVSVVMLTSAGLLQRGVAQASVLDPGFAVDALSVATIDLPDAHDPARVATLVSEVTSGLRAAKVERFAFVTNEPLGEGSFMMGFRLQGEPENRTRTVEFVSVSAGYFDTLGIPLIAGRGFVDADAGRNVAIVNESMARLWPDGTAMGRSVIGSISGPVEIVGIVRDSRVASMDAIEPVLFLPIGGGVRVFGDRVPKLIIGGSDPSAAAIVAAIVERVDKDARVEILPMRERLEDWLGELAMAPLAASALGAFALGVATVGMLGVFSYVVRQRTREIGIRMALGARAADVVRVVLASSSKAVVAGLGVGFVGALAASQILRSSLYGVSPMDPIAYGGVILVISIAALAASYVPVRRAVQIDPTRALRYD